MTVEDGKPKPFDAHARPEARDSSWYEELFRRRWNKLRPYQYIRTSSLAFGMHHFGLGIKKLTDAVLYEHTVPDPTRGDKAVKTDRFDILIDEAKESGTNMGHDAILHYLSLKGKYDTVNNGLVFQATDDKNYLLLLNLDKGYLEARAEKHGDPQFIPKMADTLRRYNIAGIFPNVDPNDLPFRQNYQASQDAKGMFVFDPHVAQMYQQVAWDGYTSKVAQKREWTNNQWMHFRLFPYELPK